MQIPDDVSEDERMVSDRPLKGASIGRVESMALQLSRHIYGNIGQRERGNLDATSDVAHRGHYSVPASVAAIGWIISCVMVCIVFIVFSMSGSVPAVMLTHEVNTTFSTPLVRSHGARADRGEREIGRTARTARAALNRTKVSE